MVFHSFLLKACKSSSHLYTHSRRRSQKKMEWRTLQLAMLFLFLGSVLSLPFQILLVMTLGAIAVTASLTRQGRTRESHSLSLSSSSDLSGNNYDVFLSFRGPDTRHAFTDFLYQKLTDAKIDVFRDEENLPVGEPIKPTLIEAIKQAKVLIPIISRDYASSRSCLMELVQILKCKKAMDRPIIPIFYEIVLSDLKDQTNSFEESFSQHQRNGFDRETIEEWKLALKEIGTLDGFEANRYHSTTIDKVIQLVLQKLKKGRLKVTNCLVGDDHHVQEIMKMLGIVHHDGQAIEICGSDVRVLGIYGIGGVGKTTLAKVVYNQLYHHFQGYSHLDKIPESDQHDGILSLQNKLISDLRRRKADFRCLDEAKEYLATGFRNRQVLILLDNVEDVDQLDAFVGELSWFGPRTRIIVTSRNSNILSTLEGAETYEVGPMEEKEALQLFSKRAFRRDFPDEGFENLSMNIVKALGRLPLALDVIGSHLFKKPEGIWRETLNELQEATHKKVERVLKIS